MMLELERKIADYLINNYTKYKLGYLSIMDIIRRYYDLFNMRMTKLYKLTRKKYFYDYNRKIFAGQNFISYLVHMIIAGLDFLNYDLRYALNYRVVMLFDIDFNLMNFKEITRRNLRQYDSSILEVCSISIFKNDLLITHFKKRDIGYRFYLALRERIIYDDLRNKDYQIVKGEDYYLFKLATQFDKYNLANFCIDSKISRLSDFYIIGTPYNCIVPNLSNSTFDKYSINKYQKCPICCEYFNESKLICSNCYSRLQY